MQVAIVAPTPPYRSGLSYYVLYLYRNLGCRVEIITNRDSVVQDVVKAFTPGPTALFSVLATLARRRPAVVHLQVEYAFLGSWLNFFLLPLATLALRLLGARTVATLHGVPTYRAVAHYLKNSVSPVLATPLAIVLTAAMRAAIALTYLVTDVVIVHTEAMRSALPLRRRARVIPHGTYVPKAAASAKSGVYTIFTFGFLRKSKGLETLVKAVEELVKSGVAARLVIVGEPLARGVERGVALPQLDFVHTYSRHVDDETLDRLIEEADVVVLPYEDLFHEVSGALHRVALFRKPVVCSNTPRFNSELTHGVDALLFPPGDYRTLARHLSALRDPQLAAALAQRLYDKFRDKTWRDVAKLHEELYRQLGGCV
ncbi:MAG: glycosyltransferase [Pyrobaculum sp.]